MVSVNFIFLHWLSNLFLWASSVPHHNYIFSQHHKIWPMLSIIIIHWNISSNTVPILQNYTAGNIVVYVTFQQIRENSKKIYILYIKFRKLCVKICEGSILNAETFLVEARQSLRCPISPQEASLSSHWPRSWHFPKWTGSELSEAFAQLIPQVPSKGLRAGGRQKTRGKTNHRIQTLDHLPAIALVLEAAPMFQSWHSEAVWLWVQSWKEPNHF